MIQHPSRVQCKIAAISLIPTVSASNTIMLLLFNQEYYWKPDRCEDFRIHFIMMMIIVVLVVCCSWQRSSCFLFKPLRRACNRITFNNLLKSSCRVDHIMTHKLLLSLFTDSRAETTLSTKKSLFCGGKVQNGSRLDTDSRTITSSVNR